MNCCACNGSCMHVGPHSYCMNHGGTWFGTVTTGPNTIPVGRAIPARELTDAGVERIAEAVARKLKKAK